MAKKTGIAWTRSTFNPWIGCTKVGPGCDHCYAEALDARHKWGGAVHWGAGVPRYRTSEHLWKQPLKWDKEAAFEKRTGTMKGIPQDWTWTRPGFWPVFCASLADVFDNEVSPQWRVDLWALIDATPNLEWLIVTKRVGIVASWMALWGWPANARLLITVCNQEEADRDIPKLLALPCKNGISYEPALGQVDWKTWLVPSLPYFTKAEAKRQSNPLFIDAGEIRSRIAHPDGVRLEWIIVGGESTQGAGKARPFDLAWARSTVAQCKAAGVPVFVKQLGSHPVSFNTSPHDNKLYDVAIKNRAGADPTEWPEDLRIQQFPE